MKVFNGKLRTALVSIMDAAAASSKVFSSPVPDRALLADIAAAVERCCTNGDVDRHVHEILFLVSNAPGSITFLSRRVTARLEAARTPAAALRPLLLVHCLLRAGDRYFEQDFRALSSSGDLRIDAARCSCSRSCSPLAAVAGKNYVSAGGGAAAAATGACSFLHGYTAYLEERIQWVINQAGNLEPIPPPHGHNDDDDGATEALLFKLAMCQRLLDLAIQLLPDNNTSSSSAAARSAFAIVLRESFKVYDAFNEGLDVMMLRSRTVEFGKSPRVSAHEIMKKACAQTPELKEFYQKCKKRNVSKTMEYPVVKVVTATQASVMELRSPATGREGDGGGAEAVQATSDGDTPCGIKLETTISAVWVEFDDEHQQTGRREATGVEHDHGSLQRPVQHTGVEHDHGGLQPVQPSELR